ncbi:MAG: hypothetical protein LBQ66_12920 [Planctomycetaceae bacterium]|nr:hypothetical protein [Planctomycetaceae bacterium]
MPQIKRATHLVGRKRPSLTNLKTKTSVCFDIIAPLGRRLFTINYRRALPYAMIFCPFRALMQRIYVAH